MKCSKILKFLSITLLLILLTACQGQKYSYKDELDKAYSLTDEKNWGDCITKLQTLLTQNTAISQENRDNRFLGLN